MLGTEARRRNRVAELRRFLSGFCPTLDKPRQRFFRQAVLGLPKLCGECHNGVFAGGACRKERSHG